MGRPPGAARAAGARAGEDGASLPGRDGTGDLVWGASGRMLDRHLLSSSAAVGALSARSTNSRRGGREPSERPSPGPQAAGEAPRWKVSVRLSVRRGLLPSRDPPRSNVAGATTGVRGPFRSQDTSLYLESSPASRGARGSNSRGPRRSLREGSEAKGPRFAPQSRSRPPPSCLSLAASRSVTL